MNKDKLFIQHQLTVVLPEIWKLDTIYFKSDKNIIHEDCKTAPLSGDAVYHYIKMFNGKNKKNFSEKQSYKITRLDFCIDTQDAKIINFARNLVSSLPDWKAFYTNGIFTGLSFYGTKNRGYSFRLYDKFQESKDERYQGLWRFEVQFTSKFFKDKKIPVTGINDLNFQRIFSIGLCSITHLITDDYILRSFQDFEDITIVNEIKEFDFGFIEDISIPKFKTLKNRLLKLGINSINPYEADLLPIYKQMCLSGNMFVLTYKNYYKNPEAFESIKLSTNYYLCTFSVVAEKNFRDGIYND